MKTKYAASILPLIVVPNRTEAVASNGPISYIIGGVIAILIMGYLIYTLLHPEKF